MANPSAPREANDSTGAKMHYGIYLDGANDVAALFRFVDAAVVADETTPSGKLAVALQPTATQGGLSISRTIAGASTNSTLVKNAAGQLYGVVVDNQNAAVRYLKFYNKATAPTVGTDTPVLTFAIPPAGTLHLEFANGIAFDTGIGIGLTTGVADNDTGAVSASEHVVNVLYK